MAHKLCAIGAYRPRIILGNRAEIDEIVELIVARSTLNEGEVYNALRELRDVISYLCRRGRPANLEGITTFTPKINLDGTYKISHRLNPFLRDAMNKKNAFKGDLVNRDNIGKTVEELIEIWDEEHPDDLVTL